MKNKSVIGRVVKTVSHSKFLIALSLVFSVASVVLSLYIPVLAGRAIDGIASAGSVDFGIVIRALVTLAVCALVSGVLQWVMTSVNNRIAYNAVRELRDAAFGRIQHLPVSYVDSHPYGDIVSRITADAEAFSDGLVLGFSQLFTGVVTVAVTLGFMLSISPSIALAVVVLTPLSLFTARFIANRTYDMFKKQSETRGEQTSLMNEMIQNQKTVQAFSYGERALGRFDGVNEKLRKYSLRATFFSSLTNPTTRFINNLIYAVVGLAGGLFAVAGRITVGAFVSFLAYSNQYTKPFNEISGVVAELQNAFACAARIYELIDEAPESSDEGKRDLENPQGNVEFRNVAFSYDKSRTLIKGFDFSASAGQKIAIVGQTGCGKTTLINLLMRFYDVDEGSILIDGENIADVTRKSLRENFGMVLQDTWLYNASIMENIRYGRLDATDEEVIAAAKAAQADHFIRTLPGGYKMELNEEASNVSQGEKQLITIARAILSNSKVMILDEATSSVDTRTEILIQKAMDNLMKGRTSFIIAHRLSTIRNADLILCMKDGDIVEQGTHDELIRLGGFYYTLYNSQFETAC